MSEKVRFKLNTQGLKELRQSKEMQQLVESTAQEKWGSHTNHHIQSFVGFDRAKAILRVNTRRYPG